MTTIIIVTCSILVALIIAIIDIATSRTIRRWSNHTIVTPLGAYTADVEVGTDNAPLPTEIDRMRKEQIVTFLRSGVVPFITEGLYIDRQTGLNISALDGRCNRDAILRHLEGDQ